VASVSRRLFFLLLELAVGTENDNGKPQEKVDDIERPIRLFVIQVIHSGVYAISYDATEKT